MILSDAVLGLLGRSWSYEVQGEDRLHQLRETRERIIYAVWHAGLLPALWRHRGDGTTLLISRHRDGRRLASTMSRWGFRVVQGSSTRGGLAALRGVIRALEAGSNVAITPDGPRGPARVAKPGVIAAAQGTGAIVLPVGIGASWTWHARSWDRFMIPAPFAKVRMIYGEPFAVPRGRAALRNGLQHLVSALGKVSRSAECG